MARTHGRIQAVIWSDADFIAMRATAQRMFMFLLSQPDLSHAGLLPMRVNRWAKKAGDLTAKSVRDELGYLAERDFIVADEDTEEVLIRTMVRNDGVYKQPKVMIRMREDARQIESPMLRSAFRAELDRLPLDELSDRPGGPNADQPSTRAQVEAVVNTLRADFAEASGYPSEGVSDTPHVRAHAFHLPPTTVPHPPSPASDHFVSDAADADADAPKSLAAIADPPRQDVEQVCDHLAGAIEANGSKRPEVTAKWRTAARLMLDKDGRGIEEVHGAIDWCQRDEFWRANVLSMPTLREKFDQLRLQAQRQPKGIASRADEWKSMQERQMARAIEREREMGIR